uniref:Uncharacterized protein n=1 Tax=Meloidogyne enterolobii TaxID=390850 RepID=A0A6V7VVN4_MELEN|nr:unnamed protein product [Meloidogyne enterolobii]
MDVLNVILRMKTQINFNKSEGSFVIGGILNERSCPSRSQTENEAKLKPLKYSHKIRIRVEHNCSVKPKTSETVEALKYYQVLFKNPIDLTQLENNIFEFRRLKINIPSTSANIDSIEWDWKIKKRGVGSNYYFPQNFDIGDW